VRKFPVDVWDSIALEYEGGQSTTILSKQYKVSVPCILRQVRKRGIEVRDTSKMLKAQVELRHFGDGKICPSCNIIKTFDEFYAVKDRSDGLHKFCKSCLYKDFRNRIQNMTPEKLKRFRDLQKKWRQRYISTEEGSQKQKEAAYRNYTSIKGRWLACRSVQKRKGRIWSLTLEEFRQLVSNQCHYCSGPLPKTSSGLDRKDNSRGYEIDNVLPCCTICNLSRRNHFTVEEMEKFIGPAIRVVREARARAWTSIDETTYKKGDVLRGKVGAV
jgi:hypothetical protein